MNYKKPLALSLLICFVFFCTLINKSVVSYQVTPGRFGDNLLTYLHAKWFAYEHDLPLIYKPFPYSSFLVLDEKEIHYQDKWKRKQLKLRPQFKTNIKNKPTISKIPFIPFNYQCPYFPESPSERSNFKRTFFPVDWKNKKFRKMVKQWIQPKEPLSLLTPPEDSINIAIHVREGGGFDANHVKYLMPLKIPPLEFYIEALQHILSLFPHKKIYCHLFTDAIKPEKIIEEMEKIVPSNMSVHFGCRKENNHHENNVLEDFFSLFHFDIMIRAESNYSIIPCLIHDYAIVYSPKNFKTQNNRIVITETNIEINENLYEKLHEM